MYRLGVLFLIFTIVCVNAGPTPVDLEWLMANELEDNKISLEEDLCLLCYVDQFLRVTISYIGDATYVILKPIQYVFVPIFIQGNYTSEENHSNNNISEDHLPVIFNNETYNVTELLSEKSNTNVNIAENKLLDTINDKPYNITNLLSYNTDTNISEDVHLNEINSEPLNATKPVNETTTEYSDILLEVLPHVLSVFDNAEVEIMSPVENQLVHEHVTETATTSVLKEPEPFIPSTTITPLLSQKLNDKLEKEIVLEDVVEKKVEEKGFFTSVFDAFSNFLG